MAFKLRSWFFENTATNVKKGTRFRNDDKPPQATFENLLDSNTFRTEAGDRAKEDTGVFEVENNGHVTLATGDQVKNYEVQKADRSLVVQPDQVTEVAEGNDVTISDFTGKTVSVTKDLSEPRRNKFIAELSTSFLTWLENNLGGGESNTVTEGNNITVTETPNPNGSINYEIAADNQLPSPTVEGAMLSLNDSLEPIWLPPTTDLGLLYVNVNNPEVGDGAITNPFQKIDDVINKIDTEGVTNATVVVSGGTYTTADGNVTANIARSGINWVFESGAKIILNNSFTDTYLFDSVVGGVVLPYDITGFGEFDLGNTRFASAVSDFSRFDSIEFKSITSSTALIISASGLSESSRLSIKGSSENSFVVCTSANAPAILSLQNTRADISNLDFASNSVSTELIDLTSIRRSVNFTDCKFAVTNANSANSLISFSGSNVGAISFTNCVFTVTSGILPSVLRFENGFTFKSDNFRDYFQLVGCRFRSDAAGRFNLLLESNSTTAVEVVSKTTFQTGNALATSTGGTGVININTAGNVQDLS
jgi:hypothetical protein